jgi:hypothetical protein
MAISKLISVPTWPVNVREMQRVKERLLENTSKAGEQELHDKTGRSLKTPVF